MVRSFQGSLPVIAADCSIDASAKVIGDVVLGARSRVWRNAVMRGDINAIRIGPRSNIQDCAVLHGMRGLYPVKICEMVTIRHNATMRGCLIEDAVLVGIGAMILNDTRIGEGSIIAAGAAIPSTPSFHALLVTGVPGKVRRALDDHDRVLILKYAQNYLQYAAIYKAEVAKVTL